MSGYPYTYNSFWGAYGTLDPFGSLNLTESSPAQTFVEPLGIDDMKDYLKIPLRSPSDTYEDALLAEQISSAREQAEILQGRDLVQKQWDLSLDYWMAYRIELRAPLISVDLVQYENSDGVVTALAERTGYIVDKAKQVGIIMPPYGVSWPVFTPRPSSAITIRFTSGYLPSHPFWNGPGARIKNGMRLLVSAWYNNRLPFEKGVDATNEYPYAVTSCLSYGSILRAR